MPQMPNIEVLAVEVKQYLGVGGKALVPRVLGQTIPKAVLETTRRSTTRAEFFSRCTPFAGRFFTRVLDEAEKAGFAVSWTSGFAIKAKWNDRFTSFLFGYTVGGERIEVYLRDQSLTESELANWQQELRAFPCLQAAGRFTLRAQIREEMEGSLFEAIRAVFEKMRQLAEQRSADKIS